MHTTTERLAWNRSNGHLVQDGNEAYLLHVPTTAVFGVDALAVAVIGECREPGGASVDELVMRLAGLYAPDRVRALAEQLHSLEMLQPPASLKPINPAGVKVGSYPLSTLVLNVNTGCNL